MKNEWKNIWNRKNELKEISRLSDESLFMKLKELDGYDAVNGGISYTTFLKQHQDIVYNLQDKDNCFNDEELNIKSVFEIGCGAGATLFMLEADGLKTGGIDYSKSLIKTAERVLKSQDLSNNEAVEMELFPIYDAVISNGVFGYFTDEKYAWSVLEKAYEKAKYVIAILDIHDEKKKEEHLNLQRKVKQNYDERYKNLPIQFYSKEFFIAFAEEKKLRIRFTDMKNMEDYWNAPYSYNVYMYK